MPTKVDPNEPREVRLKKEWFRYRHYQKMGWWWQYPKFGDFTEEEIIKMGKIIQKEAIKKSMNRQDEESHFEYLINKED